MTDLKISADLAATLYETDNGEEHQGWTRIDDQTIRTGRWMERCWLVVSNGNGTYGIKYEIGLTEEQPNEYPWEADDAEEAEVALTPLVGVPVTTTKYVTEAEYAKQLAIKAGA